MMKRLLVSMSMLFLLLPLGMQSITPIQAAATAHTRAAYDRHESIDPAIIQMIHDVVEQIAVPTTIADYARERDWDKVMEFARKPGVNVNAQDERGINAWSYAMYHNKLDIFKFLVEVKDEKGKRVVNLKHKYSDGSYALSYAVNNGLLEFVKYLVEQKDEDNNWMFDLNERDTNGFTLFIDAAYRGHLDIVQYLAEIKDRAGKRVVSLDACDDHGRTALIWAAKIGRVEVVKYLRYLDVSDYMQQELQK